MITYATLDEFKNMKDFEKTGLVTLPAAALDKIRDYLKMGTRYIERTTKRSFVPYYATKTYPVPHRFHDLAIRRFPTANLRLDEDLLEVVTMNNGVSDLVESTDYFLLENNIYPKNLVALKFPNYWGGISGINLKRYDEPVINITGFWGFADKMYPINFWVDSLEVIGVGGITASTTTITVLNADGSDSMDELRFTENMMLRIDDELLEVTDVNTTTNVLTVLRGVRGSTAAIHAAGTQITRWRVIDDIKQVCLQVAKTWREANIAVGGRIGVSDVSAGVEIGIPADPLAIIKMYVKTIL